MLKPESIEKSPLYPIGKPVVGFTYRGLEDPLIKGLLERGLPVFQDSGRAARALAALSRYSAQHNSALDLREEERDGKKDPAGL